MSCAKIKELTSKQQMMVIYFFKLVVYDWFLNCSKNLKAAVIKIGFYENEN